MTERQNGQQRGGDYLLLVWDHKCSRHRVMRIDSVKHPAHPARRLPEQQCRPRREIRTGLTGASLPVLEQPQMAEWVRRLAAASALVLGLALTLPQKGMAGTALSLHLFSFEVRARSPSPFPEQVSLPDWMAQERGTVC